MLIRRPDIMIRRAFDPRALRVSANEVYGGPCGALMKRPARVRLLAPRQGPALPGREDWPSGKASVSKTVVGVGASRRFDPCILRRSLAQLCRAADSYSAGSGFESPATYSWGC